MTRARLADQWSLDPAVIHLNHGSFGAAPQAVLDAQTEWRQRLEANPMRFFAREGQAHLDDARNRLAGFVGADPANIAFVSNASAGVNSVLRSLQFEAGDEILVTNHGYGAAVNAARYVADRSGGRIVVAEVGMPIGGEDEVVAAILEASSPHTRLALIDHVTSSTAVVFPIPRIVAELAERGIPVLVDGAHAPGMLDLDVTAVGADYYTGNCHKWVCAPKGAAFLWVREPATAGIVPLAVGWGRSSRPAGRSQFHADFDWVGTDDPTPYLAVPAAIDFMGSLYPGRWAELRARNRELALAGSNVLLPVLGAAAPVPDDMLGSMAALPLPPAPHPPPTEPDALQLELAADGIEVAVVHGPARGDRWLRISAQAYNSLSDYEALAEALGG